MTFEELAQQIAKNFDQMTARMMKLANVSSVWPSEAELSAELGAFDKRHKELRQQLFELMKAADDEETGEQK